MAKVGFTTKDGTVVSFTTKKRASRKTATTALATRANGRVTGAVRGPLTWHYEPVYRADGVQKRVQGSVVIPVADEPYHFVVSANLVPAGGGQYFLDYKYGLDVQGGPDLPEDVADKASLLLDRLGFFDAPRRSAWSEDKHIHPQRIRYGFALWSSADRDTPTLPARGTVKELTGAIQRFARAFERGVRNLSDMPTHANKRKPAARKPAKRTPVARGKDKATYKFYVVFRGPPNGVNIHAGFATQQAARAFITKKFHGTRRLQVRGRPGLVKSGHNPKVAKNWKTFSLAASLKASPAPRKRTTRRNSSQLPGLAYGGRSLAARYGSYTTKDPWETCIAAAERADNEARKASYEGDAAEAKRLRAQRDAWLAQAETYLKKNRSRR